MITIDRVIDFGFDLALAALIFTLVGAIAGRIRVEFGKTQLREKRVSLLIAVFDSLLILPIVALPYLYLVQGLGLSNIAQLDWDNQPPFVSILCVIVVGDLIGYLRHRLEHTFLLWPVHVTHHSDEAMNWLTLLRMHPFNRFTTVTIDTTILFLIGFPPFAILVNGMVRHWWGFFIHVDAPWTLGALGEMFVSPAAHRVHHAKDELLAGCNFATIFTYWDKLFGTWKDPNGFLDVATGVEDGSPGFLIELGRPFVMWSRIVKSRCCR